MSGRDCRGLGSRLGSGLEERPLIGVRQNSRLFAAPPHTAGRALVGVLPLALFGHGHGWWVQRASMIPEGAQAAGTQAADTQAAGTQAAGTGMRPEGTFAAATGLIALRVCNRRRLDPATPSLFLCRSQRQSKADL